MIRILLVISLLTLITSCQERGVFKHHENIAGIPHTLWIHEVNEDVAQRAASAVFSELRLLSQFTHPVHSKPIARSNALLRSREWFSVNPSMTGILKQAIEYARQTDNAFNPAALGAFRELWGQYDDKSHPPPTEPDIAGLLADLPTMEDIRFDAIRLRGNNPRIRLDFDWLAHGYAIDMQVQHLREMGIEHAKLKIGQVEMETSGPGQARCRRSLDAGHGVIDTRTGRPIKAPATIEVAAHTASDAAVGCWVLLVENSARRQQVFSNLGLTGARITGSDGTVTTLGHE